ncbi:MAG: glycoside hydrolase family 2 TIM barrel-domain containing protein [Bacteroidota bacterium]|nr:glycoside hydrolase family 2 TIM barrel-domain containing protein [Bacteroidota bacterium]
MKKRFLPLYLWLGCLPATLFSQNIREIDLSGLDWKISLDKQAEWQNDKLYLPPVDLKKLPVHLPSGGWAALNQMPQKTVHLPATVEQHFWGYNGSTFGVTGNYTGVSWFTTQVNVPAEMKGKRIFLNIESVRFRAEIFVNRQPVGYDVVNSTPFQVEITDAVEYGKVNEIAFRITDPNGNFNWKDSQNYMWGDYRTIPSHGFGGITGKVTLSAKDKGYIEDVFVKNKPRANEVDVEVTTQNSLPGNFTGTYTLEVREHTGQKLVYTRNYPATAFPAGKSVKKFTLSLPEAKLWSVDFPNLYDLTVRLKGEKSEDVFNRRFGFRWFEVYDKDGNREFRLNGKRIVLRTAISWSFWPDNGIVPDDSLAKKQVMVAKRLGLNMLNFHRTIGYTNVLDYADELGLLYFEEPGGNSFPVNLFFPKDSIGKMQSDFYLKARTEKLSRMVKRDRSHPSLIIYNMHNERGAAPQQPDYDEMAAAHRLDETRILTYNSCNGNNPVEKPDAHFKTHLLPYDSTFHDTGWWDEHHAGGPGVYHDFLYKNANDYHRGSTNKNEIVYWGEEGAIGTPPRLELIRNEILKSGKTTGWEADDYLQWYDAYDSFLKNNPGFSKAFPSVDALTKSMGNVSYYYQGRMIENIRINNVVDGYAVNGWESMKLENHSGIVDNYRNPKGDVELIARYNKPLYVAVKMNRKVVEVGNNTTVDFHIVNEENLHGGYQLKATVTDESGHSVLTKTFAVKLSGGDVYGELLKAGWNVPVNNSGYYTVKAELIKNGKIVSVGDDQILGISANKPNTARTGMVADTTGILSRFLSAKGIDTKEYESGAPKGDYLLVGGFEPQQWGSGISDIMEWVYSGHTLIIVNNAERWAEFLSDKEVLDYRGSKKLGTSWYGGNFFVKEHPLFEGLPQNCVFNWEYQCFATYNRKRTGLRLFNGETVVGCVSDHKKEVYSALSVIPAGRGKIVLCTLDIFSCIQDLKPVKKVTDIDGENASMNTFNTSGNNQSNVVGQRLLLNMIKFAER